MFSTQGILCWWKSRDQRKPYHTYKCRQPEKDQDQFLETYIKAVKLDVNVNRYEETQQIRPRQPESCSNGRRSNVQWNNVTIKPADKGSSVVVLSTRDYIQEEERQLSNSLHHKKLERDPTATFSKEISTAIKSLHSKGCIDVSTKKYLPLGCCQPRTARLYLLLKIHQPGNPGRPIVSSYNDHRLEISVICWN